MERCGAPVSIRKNEALKKWMADLKDAAYDADDILDEFNYEVLRRQRGEIPDRMKKKVWDFFSFRNPNVFRIKMINKIKEIVGRLDNIAAEKSKFHLTEIGQADRQRPQTHSFVNESQIIGREKDKKKTVESLMSRAGRSDVSVLPIVGIGGLGKTTLAQLVYNEITAAEHFEQRMWVCVLEDFDIKKHRQDNYGISNRDECWSLFERNAFSEGGADKSANLIHIGKAIVEKCGGLPLAAKMLGRSMRTMREGRGWRSVMESKIWDIKDDKILLSLKLSYNHLHSHMKQCFAYCATFPKDYEIDKEMLIQLWMANGFIPFDPEKDIELKGHEIFNELSSRSLFQDIKEFRQGIITFRMHDLIHDLAQSVIGNECCILEKPRSISNTTLRHLSVTMHDPKISSMEKVHTFNTLRTLLLLRDWESDFDLSHINWEETKLRALGLRGAMIYDFPISRLHVKHLRYLDLSKTNISTLPEATSNLLNLQTLNLSYCDYLQQLPKGIRKMSSLRHLYLHGCIRLESMPRGTGELKCLHTLTAYPVGNEIESGSIKELKDLCIGGMLELYRLKNVRSVAES